MKNMMLYMILLILLVFILSSCYDSNNNIDDIPQSQNQIMMPYGSVPDSAIFVHPAVTKLQITDDDISPNIEINLKLEFDDITLNNNSLTAIILRNGIIIQDIYIPFEPSLNINLNDLMTFSNEYSQIISGDEIKIYANLNTGERPLIYWNTIRGTVEHIIPIKPSLTHWFIGTRQYMTFVSPTYYTGPKFHFLQSREIAHSSWSMQYNDINLTTNGLENIHTTPIAFPKDESCNVMDSWNLLLEDGEVNDLNYPHPQQRTYNIPTNSVWRIKHNTPYNQVYIKKYVRCQGDIKKTILNIPLDEYNKYRMRLYNSYDSWVDDITTVTRGCVTGRKYTGIKYKSFFACEKQRKFPTEIIDVTLFPNEMDTINSILQIGDSIYLTGINSNGTAYLSRYNTSDYKLNKEFKLPDDDDQYVPSAMTFSSFALRYRIYILSFTSDHRKMKITCIDVHGNVIYDKRYNTKFKTTNSKFMPINSYAMNGTLYFIGLMTLANDNRLVIYTHDL